VWNLGVAGWWGGVGTLLGPEGSGIPEGSGTCESSGPPLPVVPGWGVVGVGGRASCDLNSGREHLATRMCLLVVGGWWVGVGRVEAISSLCSFC
jgi:hypothetical protein